MFVMLSPSNASIRFLGVVCCVKSELNKLFDDVCKLPLLLFGELTPVLYQIVIVWLLTTRKFVRNTNGIVIFCKRMLLSIRSAASGFWFWGLQAYEVVKWGFWLNSITVKRLQGMKRCLTCVVAQKLNNRKGQFTSVCPVQNNSSVYWWGLKAKQPFAKNHGAELRDSSESNL